MNDLCADIGYKSINHFGEELCGDHVDVVEEKDDNDDEYIYATADEIKLLNPKIVDDYALGIDNVVIE